MRLLSAVLLAALSLTATAAVQADDAKSDTQGIQGTWTIIRVEIDGNPLPEGAFNLLMGYDFEQVQFVFDGEKLRIIDKSGEHEMPEATFNLDQTKRLNALDLTFLNSLLKGKKVACIYELNGDDLKLVWPTSGNVDRPTEFKTAPGSGLALYVLKRVK